MKVYFDNAATTPLSEDVWKAMEPFYLEHFGNPSSTHSFGRKTKNAIESARREIASAMNVLPGQIIFTGSGTEGNNTILSSAVQKGVNHIITSPIEHHAVLHTLDFLSIKEGIKISKVELDEDGNVNLSSLEQLLKTNSEDKKLVSLMHVNNEIGNILPISEVVELCHKFNTLFHSDTVQSIGTLPLDLKSTPIDFATCSAHKFHGPKGVGFMYVKDSSLLESFIHGGSQERGHRAGTENVAGIIGMSRALKSATENLNKNYDHLTLIRNYFIEKISQIDSNIKVIGNQPPKVSPKILNLCIPSALVDDMLLFNLDLRGIAASGGSACSSGSNQGSHVINEIKNLRNCLAIRFSFSKYNTIEEVDYVIAQIKEILKK
ncbi:MAG: cysteine desulfurase [Flavobacteriales bacterium]|nr:cysteine desulfurase [Flavobacteriales bacterium]